MKTLVVADVHLKVDAGSRSPLGEFVAFLRSLNPSEFGRIVIVGDLFDFWFEYQHVVFSGYFEVLRALADLRDAGVECHLVCGNHDFWAGRFFRDELGFGVHADCFECDLDGRRARFVHGDGINPADRWYNAYKRIARSWLAVKLMWAIHPDFAMGIARRVSHASRNLQDPAGTFRAQEIAAIRDYASTVIASGAADIVVCGHTHVAAHEEFPSPRGHGLYVNTGGWVDDRAYWIWDGEAFARYSGLLTARHELPLPLAEERQRVALRPIDVPCQKAE